ncbi:MAG TPA: cupin domain-containing protein [Bryobacteraceae bacterium]|nr:cupin domain-containing protein [Bryobacteraceae bacterium]
MEKAMRAVHISGEEKAKHPGSRREWGSQVWMANRALTGSSLSLTRMILTPGHSGEAHRHPNADEVIYLIKGKVEVRAGAETFALEATDALAIPGGLSHQIHNPGVEDAELLISYSTGDREYVPGSTVEKA